ncbi:MAG: GNAT family N-acetyltransferase [Ilumatobacter sp.]|uniref:GNAT family N-acetyltransferase n=1 Tax=Ilumatobacter sp. TaxID=1967498 RepID=UPI003C725CC2
MNYVVRHHAVARCPDIGDLEQIAAAEDHSFVTRTRQEWEAGINRFDQAGETFFFVVEAGRTVGICGLNIDPYIEDPSVGRLRHLYIHPSCRRAGIAAVLVETCLSAAPGTFDRVRLRTSNPAADALYRCSGALPAQPEAVHLVRRGSRLA